ncbi:MAG: ATP-binding cassette domain-containing protein [Alphaproteobacteria bacterium]
MAALSGARLLLKDFLGFARARSAAAIALIIAGALLEGAGIVMLVPIVALILGIAGNAEATALVAPFFDRLGLDSMAGRIGVVLGVFAAVLGLRFAVLLFRDDILARLQLEFVVDLRSRAFRRLAQMPWGEVAGLQHGPVGHSLTRDVDRVAGGVGLAVQGGVAAVMLAVQLALALALAPVVTVVAALLGVTLFRSLRWLRDRAESRGEALTADDLTLFQTVGGFLRGLKPAKAHGLEDDYVVVFERAAKRLAEQNRAFILDHVLARLILQTASGGIAILAILLGLFVLGTRPENLIVTLIILARLHTPLQVIQNTAQGIRHSAVAYRAAREMAGPAAGTMASAPAAPPEPLEAAPGISLEAVSWRGGETEGPPILDRVSAEIPAGQVTVLIGESGAGKSTLCDLAVGLLAPDSGEVNLDGATLEGALADCLRASIAYVGQEPFLFEDSLRHNLCWGCAEASDAAIWQALETVGADGLARGLEGGLDGRIRTEGMRFSGGERQRFRLARALLRRPRFLVLDEATNALDHDAEARVLAALLAARGGATVLMVSHRPENLRLADHVILLEAGRLAETGPVAALAKDPSSRIGALLAPGAG